MKIHPSSCCGQTARSPVRLIRVIVVLGVVMLVAGALAGRRDGQESFAEHPKPVVVSAQTPRAIVVSRIDGYEVQISDMGNEISLFLTDANGHAVPLADVTARAMYAPRGARQQQLPLRRMNDHLMATINPQEAGAVVVSFTTRDGNHRTHFELPIMRRVEDR